MKKHPIRLGITAVLLVAVVAGAVWLVRSHRDTDGKQPAALSGTTARTELFKGLTSLYAPDPANPSRGLMDLLPAQLYVVGKQPPAPLLDGLLIGTITKVAAGHGFTADAAAAANPKTLDFDDPHATWRTLEVTTKVEIGWGGVVAGRDEVTFLLRVPGSMDPDVAIAGVKSLDEVVVGLDGLGMVAAERDMALVGDRGALFGPVEKDGTLTMPVLGDDAARYLGGITTTDILRRQASAPRKTKVRPAA